MSARHQHGRDDVRRSRQPVRVRRRGMALVMVMVIVAVAVALGYAMLSNASLQAQVGANLQRTAAAECLAESGVELAIYYLQNPANTPNSWIAQGKNNGRMFEASGVAFGKREDKSDVDGSVDFYATPDATVAGKYIITATGHARPGTSSQADHTSTVVVTMTTAHLGVGSYGSVTLKNRSYTDGYYINSLSPWDAAFGRKSGTIVTNGSISLSNDSKINGDATPGIGKTATGGTVTGSRSPLTVAVAFPDFTPDGAAAALLNDNAQISPTFYNPLTGNFGILANQTADFQGGTYYFNDFIMADDAKLAIHNPVTIYVKNQLTIKGGFTLPYNVAAMVKFRVLSNKAVSVSGGALFYMDLSAPNSVVTVTKSHIYGSVVGGSLTLDGAAVHWDEGLESAGSSQVGTMRIVSFTP